MAEVAEIASRQFPDLLVDVENKTLGDLEANTWACRKSTEQKKPAMYKRAFEIGEEKDYMSATETTIMVSIHGSKRKIIDHFRGLVAFCAKKYCGTKTGEDSNSNYSDADYRFFTYVNYSFRG